MTTYDENGGYPHPDHIRCHDVSVAAFAAAGDPRAYPTAGPPWQPLKLYYNATFTRARIEAFHTALTALGEESPYAEWLENWSRPDREVTTRVQCADWFDRRDAALLAHATQVDPDGSWFRVSREVQQEVWPTEEFEAAASYVPVVEGEDDLFAGLPEDTAEADALATSAFAAPGPRLPQGASGVTSTSTPASSRSSPSRCSPSRSGCSCAT